MKIIFAYLLVASAISDSAAADQLVLKSQGIYCEAKYKESIEEIADAKSDRALKRAVGAALMSGECINSGIEVPSLINRVSKETTSRGSIYYCYVRWGDDARFCSDARSIATVSEIQSERSGDFEVIADNEKVLVAKCTEGGRVYVEKGSQWHRKSAIFFGNDDPAERAITQDKERAAREGCKGLDF